MRDGRLFLLLALYTGALISITLFEALVVLALLVAFLDVLKERQAGGALRTGVLLYGFSTLAGTLLFFPRMFHKALEEGLFQFVYFLKIPKDTAKRFSDIFLKILVVSGLILLPVALFRYAREGEPKLIWGGSFEAGFFFGLFALGSFLLSVRESSSKRLFFAFLFLLFGGMVFLSARRSMMLAFVFMFLLVVLILVRSGVLSRRVLALFGLLVFLISAGGYAWLSERDARFRTLNEILLGKRELTYETLNVISSKRAGLFLDGLEVLREDIREGRLLELLFGHGVRAGAYLPHKHAHRAERYESVFLLSELIERGVLGLLGILLIYVAYFRTLSGFRVRDVGDLGVLALFLPLGLHLIQTVFTYFWDALLPLYLVLFRAGESLGRR
ncbi:MAG: hypothetical protein GXO04_06070 [Aquificae bacterium]|nr:hypothetical protein [Aquificota bacterium]